MELRRALVVDDSKSARIALKKQLEEYDLEVDLADSGEEALELLQDHKVDVIFMDHVMPGMDGLEAVTALKSNPSTATIPVMMYTSKEGELYVSQARALGAVDVLPKQVQPGVLFRMLLKLGLVRDRRNPESEEDIEATEPADDHVATDEPAAGGVPMQSILTRIIEDQNVALRSDILRSHRRFAGEVANQVYEQLKADDAEVLEQKRVAFNAGLPILTAIFGAIALLFGLLFLQARSERDAIQESFRLLAEQRTAAPIDEQPSGEPGAAKTGPESAGPEVLSALTWAMNQAGSVPYGELPFNSNRAEKIDRLLSQLREAGFEGTVRVESHLGEFCLASDSSGVYRMVDEELPYSACTLIGHPLEDSSLLSEHVTPVFEAFMVESQIANGPEINLELIARTRLDSVPLVSYPANPQSAGEWNRVAAQNNRLEFLLLSNTGQ